MGFKLPQRTVTIGFDEGHDFHGLEVVLSRNAPMSLLFLARKSGAQMSDGEFFDLAEGFSEHILLSWNLEDADGTPIPATFESVKEQPPELLVALLDKWGDVVMSPAAPLGEPSSNGASSEELSVPMEPLSESPTS